MASCDTLLLNATTLMANGTTLKRQAVAIANGRICWTGSTSQVPHNLLYQAKCTEHCNEQLITPGLIDCHTHLVYAGNRANEFKHRLEGVSYQDIAKRGGGILATVQHTRNVSETELLDESLPRIKALQRQGVTMVEIKSGYGLNLDDELKMLRVAKRLEQISGVKVKTTFLGAHAVPIEYRNNSQAYVDFLCQEVMPVVQEQSLADAVDVFCESIGFSLKQTEQLFEKATSLGLRIKCHAEQLSNLGATALAAKYHALSTDHLEYLDKEDVIAMATSNVIAVLLPGAYYFLKETRKPPVALLRQAGVGMAVATDCNPGTSPTTSLWLMMSMACQLFSLTVSEVWSAVTYQAARALDVADDVGSIAEGLRADLIRWPFCEPEQLCYQFGFPFSLETMVDGQWLNGRT